MSYLVVCPLAEIEVVAARHDPSHMVSLVDATTPVARPPMIEQKNHLFLKMNDIAQSQAGLVPPTAAHVQALLDFAEDWARLSAKRPLLVHCWLGISRSTAAAFIIACRLWPERAEQDIAHDLRFHAPFATPNPRLVALADELLFGTLADGGRVSVNVKDDALVVEAQPEPEKLLPATV